MANDNYVPTEDEKLAERSALKEEKRTQEYVPPEDDLSAMYEYLLGNKSTMAKDRKAKLVNGKMVPNTKEVPTDKKSSQLINLLEELRNETPPPKIEEARPKTILRKKVDK